MSYEISSPVEITNNGVVSVSYADSTSSQVWSTRTDPSSRFIIDNTSTPNNFVIDPVGNVSVSNSLALKNAGNSVSIAAASGTTNYALSFPSTSPGNNQVMIFSSGGSSVWTNLTPSIKNTVVVQKTPSSGQFSSILSAVNSIPSSGPNAPSDTNRYCVLVYPGVYSETASISVPSFVFIVGVNAESVIVQPSTTGYDLFILTFQTGLSFMSIRNVSSPSVGVYFHNVGNFSSIHKVNFSSCPCSMLADSSSRASFVYLEYVSTTSASTYSLMCTDNNSGFALSVNINDLTTSGHSNDAIIVEGINTQVLIQSATLQDGDGSGNGITIESGGSVTVMSVYIQLYQNAINVPQDSGSPSVTITNAYFDECTMNLDITNSNASGYFVGYSQYTKNSINPSNTFFIADQDQNVVTVSSKGSDFTTVSSALAAITTASTTNRYIISVGPGIYTESSLVLKPYVAIIGISPNTVILVASSPNQTFITAVGNSALRNVTLTTGVQFPTPPVAGGSIN